MKTKTTNSLKEKDPAGSPRVTAGAESAMDGTTEALVIAYLAANLNFKDIPLKRLMDDCEKQILLGGLQLSRGSQRNAAVLLGIKPTALFEKMRKHGINSRRIKMSEKLEALPPQG